MIDAVDEETKGGLSTGEIVADSVGFLLAGYGTTSVTLTFATYLLATHPEVQEKLANEIHDYLEEHPVCTLCVVGYVQPLGQALKILSFCKEVVLFQKGKDYRNYSEKIYWDLRLCPL